jgi:predicted ABC-type ATPase
MSVSCTIKVRDLDAITRRYTSRAHSVKPIFFVSYGPSGSGKSAVARQLFQYMHVEASEVVNVLVDQIMEDLHLETDPANYRKNRDDYADTIRENIISAAIREKKNILVEITGNSITDVLTWITSARDNGFKTVVFYPFVKIPILVQRLRAREATEPRTVARDAVLNHTINAPKNFSKIIEMLYFSEYYFVDNNLHESMDTPTPFVDKIIFVLKTGTGLEATLWRGNRYHLYQSDAPEIYDAAETVKQTVDFLEGHQSPPPSPRALAPSPSYSP